MTGDHHGRSQREPHRDHEREASAGPPPTEHRAPAGSATTRPRAAAGPAPTTSPHHDPGLPILRELEELVRAAAVAAGAGDPRRGTAAQSEPSGRSAVGAGHVDGTAPRGRRPAGWAVGGIVPRGLVLALVACTVGATATALTRSSSSSPGDGPAVTVLRGSAGAADWRLQVARRGGRFCVSLTAAGPTVAGASVDPDCQAAPGRRAVVPRTFATADRVVVHGLAGPSVRAVAVTLDGVRRTRRSVPVPGAGGVRAFALVLRRSPANGAADAGGPAPRVRPLGRGGRSLGPALRDCSTGSCPP